MGSKKLTRTVKKRSGLWDVKDRQHYNRGNVVKRSYKNRRPKPFLGGLHLSAKIRKHKSAESQYKNVKVHETSSQNVVRKLLQDVEGKVIPLTTTVNVSERPVDDIHLSKRNNIFVPNLESTENLSSTKGIKSKVVDKIPLSVRRKYKRRKLQLIEYRQSSQVTKTPQELHTREDVPLFVLSERNVNRQQDLQCAEYLTKQGVKPNQPVTGIGSSRKIKNNQQDLHVQSDIEGSNDVQECTEDIPLSERIKNDQPILKLTQGSSLNVKTPKQLADDTPLIFLLGKNKNHRPDLNSANPKLQGSKEIQDFANDILPSKKVENNQLIESHCNPESLKSRELYLDVIPLSERSDNLKTDLVITESLPAPQGIESELSTDDTPLSVRFTSKEIDMKSTGTSEDPQVVKRPKHCVENISNSKANKKSQPDHAVPKFQSDSQELMVIEDIPVSERNDNHQPGLESTDDPLTLQAIKLNQHVKGFRNSKRHKKVHTVHDSSTFQSAKEVQQLEDIPLSERIKNHEPILEFTKSHYDPQNVEKPKQRIDIPTSILISEKNENHRADVESTELRAASQGIKPKQLVKDIPRFKRTNNFKPSVSSSKAQCDFEDASEVQVIKVISHSNRLKNSQPVLEVRESQCDIQDKQTPERVIDDLPLIVFTQINEHRQTRHEFTDSRFNRQGVKASKRFPENIPISMWCKDQLKLESTQFDAQRSKLPPHVKVIPCSVVMEKCRVDKEPENILVRQDLETLQDFQDGCGFHAFRNSVRKSQTTFKSLQKQLITSGVSSQQNVGENVYFNGLVNLTKNNIVEDEDYFFLLSMLPHLRKIPHCKKLKVRTEIQTVIINNQ